MIARLTNGKNLDSEYDPTIGSIQIVAPGIIVRRIPNGTETDIRWFYPWHQVEWIMGTAGEHEHELAQLEYLD